jgi:hypothetical protein
MRKNIYRCPRGHDTVTVDRDEMSQSSFYQVDQNRVATVEFYKPTHDDPCMQDEAIRDHVNMGGLMPRQITT